MDQSFAGSEASAPARWFTHGSGRDPLANAMVSGSRYKRIVVHRPKVSGREGPELLPAPYFPSGRGVETSFPVTASR
jgi:hypothetical protein